MTSALPAQLMDVFILPGNVIGGALGIKHQDMIDVPYLAISAAAWGLLAYLIFKKH